MTIDTKYGRELVEARIQAMEAENRCAELEDAINRDRTGLAAALGKIVDEVKGRGWIAEGRGSYEWDDDRYRDEAGAGFAAVKAIAVEALAKSGTIVSDVLIGRKPVVAKYEARVAELEAERDRMRPVVDAAVVWLHRRDIMSANDMVDAVSAYLAATPKEPR